MGRGGLAARQRSAFPCAHGPGPSPRRLLRRSASRRRAPKHSDVFHPFRFFLPETGKRGFRLNRVSKKPEGIRKRNAACAAFSQSVKNPRDCQGPQPLTFHPALTACASERMKTFRFSHFSDFAARKRGCVSGKICSLKKVQMDFFDTLRNAACAAFSIICCAGHSCQLQNPSNSNGVSMR